jgi:lipopolysaccharide transport protein LptA
LLTAVAGAANRTADVVLDAASSEVDYASNRYLFRDVTITQGEIRVTADEAQASGTDFNNALWEFKGKVRIKLPGGALRSNSARVQFRNNIIATAQILGTPAEFEQQRSIASEPARGRAVTIEYNVTTNTIRLLANAWLSDGRNEISGSELVYDLAAQKVQAQTKPGDDGRVRITIRPQLNPASGTPPPQTPASSPPPTSGTSPGG